MTYTRRESEGRGEKGEVELRRDKGGVWAMVCGASPTTVGERWGGRYLKNRLLGGSRSYGRGVRSKVRRRRLEGTCVVMCGNQSWGRREASAEGM